MLLGTILCKFGQIWPTGNTVMQQETILCEFGQICATGNALMQLETILSEFGQIHNWKPMYKRPYRRIVHTKCRYVVRCL